MQKELKPRSASLAEMSCPILPGRDVNRVMCEGSLVNNDSTYSTMEFLKLDASSKASKSRNKPERESFVVAVSADGSANIVDCIELSPELTEPRLVAFRKPTCLASEA